jgi:toxin YoeB
MKRLRICPFFYARSQRKSNTGAVRPQSRVTTQKLVSRINDLIRECTRTPFSGAGKPEPLRGEFAGYWLRRINQEHRLVYKVGEDALIIVQCGYHY